MFITLAGIDGSGKTTLASELAAMICKQGYRVRLTREPGGTRIGKQIRSLVLNLGRDPALEDMNLAPQDSGAWYADVPAPLTETLLFTAARAQHVLRIRQWLEAGEVVICDRFTDCTRAYQGARGVPAHTLEVLEHISTSGLRPDLTFFLELSPEDAAQRLFWGRREKDVFDRQSIDFFMRVQENYRRIARQDRERVVTLNASRSPEEIAEKAWLIAMQKLKGNEMAQGQSGRPLEVRADVLEVLRELAETQEVVLLIDVMRHMEAQGNPVSRTTVQRAMHTETDEWPEGYLTKERRALMRTEIWKRVNEQKKRNGNTGLARQAEQGYPNLVKAREVRAANRGAEYA